LFNHELPKETFTWVATHAAPMKNFGQFWIRHSVISLAAKHNTLQANICILASLWPNGQSKLKSPVTHQKNLRHSI